MALTNHKKEFTEENNPEEQFRLYLLNLLENPPKCDHRGRKWGDVTGTIWEQFQEYILDRHPDLKERIEEDKFKKWIDLVKPFIISHFSEENTEVDIWPKDHAANILHRETVKICLRKGCSYSEAFSDACIGNPGMANFYYEDIHGR